MRKFEGTFEAVDDRDQSYVIEMYTDVGPGGLKGFSSMFTKDGQPVNRIDKGKYEIVTFNVKLTSTDPNAP